ncbi:MAG: PQQ-binding-like beta-propeller repeat protein [Planctomycetota bacterium]|nr:PQQ-binding-like beta-propeller repeat protein [Planctomycetota bacterium]
MKSNLLLRAITTIVILSWLTLNLSAETNWTQWRGMQCNGLSDARNVPQQFSTDSIIWKTQIPGRGQSSPVYWEDTVFITSALQNGTQRAVFAVDRSNGKIRWQKVVWQGEAEETHAMNNRASSTCVTDGKQVVAFFGKAGLHSLDVETGKIQWSRDLGNFDGPWGTGASPIFVGELVVQNCDADNESWIMAFSRTNGETVWKTKRDTVRGWSTPILFKQDGQTEIIINGHSKVVSYNPSDGHENWQCTASAGRGTPTLAMTSSAVISVPGRSGTMVAIRPGGTGDVTGKREVWRVPRTGGRDLPSPIVVGEYVIVTRLRPGLISCYRVSDGSELWTTRVSGAFSSSPIAINGIVYTVTESGSIVVFKPGEKYVPISTNEIGADLEEIFRATPAAFDGHLLVRSDQYLYCLGTPK